MKYPTITGIIGNTPIVELTHICAEEMRAKGNVILAKLEGNNPAGSVKDRAALAMITNAQARGEIQPGDTLIEPTSGNTGIALAMIATVMGYRMVVVMPENLSLERTQTMKALGAELILTPRLGGMEYARDLAAKMVAEGKGYMLNQFSNMDNPRAHYETTGPEIWAQTSGRITHFVSAMGSTGTITGVGRYLKEQNSDIKILGAQPSEKSNIPGIRKWPQAYLPSIFNAQVVDQIIDVSQDDAESMAQLLSKEEGLFAGISTGAALWATLQFARKLDNATIVFVACDRGDRYFSSGIFPI